MNSKNEKKSSLKRFCLKFKLKRLESKRNEEIMRFILNHPDQAARMDNVETKMNSDTLTRIDFKIKALRRLIEQVNKN